MASDNRKTFAAARRDQLEDRPPDLPYVPYFKLFGLVSTGVDVKQIYGPIKSDKSGGTIKRLYCQFVCALLWFFSIRSFVLMFISDRPLQIIMGDITGYWNDYRMYYLMPMLYYSFQAAVTCTVFLRNEHEISWLVPYYTSKMFNQNQGTRIFSKDTHGYRGRNSVMILIATVAVTAATTFWGYLWFTTAFNNLDEDTFTTFIPWIVLNTLWMFYVAGISTYPAAYFNVVAVILSRRFKRVCSEIEDLADSDPGPPGSKNSALQQVYFDHNEVCELVDESNQFWMSYIFFTFMLYIPCNCYALYNLFFADFDDILGPITWSVFWHTIIILAIVALSAAGVSSEAHAPYTALHTLSLLQLPIDLEVNMSTFLHRIRGPTIGFSCLDLFVVTNATISNTIAAVASYFLIVADFSRSTVAAHEAEIENRRRAEEELFRAAESNKTIAAAVEAALRAAGVDPSTVEFALQGGESSSSPMSVSPGTI